MQIGLGWQMFIIQPMPNLSRSSPYVSPQISFESGFSTVPPSASLSQ